jgi:hypothetical protein
MTATVTGVFPMLYCEKSSTSSRAETPQRGSAEFRQTDQINAWQSRFQRSHTNEIGYLSLFMREENRADKYQTFNSGTVTLLGLSLKMM